MLNRDSLAKIDYTLFFIIFLFACISYLSISMAPLKSGAPALGMAHRQIAWYIFSTIVAIGIMFFDYDRLKRMHWIFYGIGMALLLGLTFAQLGVPIPMVDKSHGAMSWYALPGIGQLQPSEFMKLFMIVSIATTIDKHNEEYSIRGLKEDMLLLGKIALVSFPPFLLVFAQPDLGTALVMFSIIVSMTLVSGINWKLIVGILAAIICGLAFFAISWFHFPEIVNIFLQSHQKNRFLAWQDPEKYSDDFGYQLIQSLKSIGSGEFFNYRFNSAITLPESYNDFIFAVIGGSFGFVGAVTVILLFFLFISRVIKAAVETHDPFGSYICTGIVGMVMFQVFENIGMTIQVMPVTGITLPFLSYGGSSLLSSMICVGIVQSVRMQTQKFMFS
ncbi:rod shape-determining protein RodA [Sporolactobacillus shoreicorticis]|uniref:FtsW/RodA/SpoVE family cell cycle protein n=1 Tax=Sporolactobacillus shoreicorticis TaxID=1923877 RepID=A0ABW5S7D7_9BACL|nr:FtsW/RodA/SpoVE family cell cycle protein [Sporolactobacillus shoreicorticis]MCO7126202.1 rod shape-determining protein RodA [Sporolactobacillus shoreicorticis]